MSDKDDSVIECARWTLSLTTLAGEELNLDILPSERVRDLKVIASKRMGRTDSIDLLLGDVLLDNSETVEACGLHNGASLILTFSKVLCFERTMVPKSNTPDDPSIKLEPVDDSDDATLTTVAKFQSGGSGYRCAVGSPLLEFGCQHVFGGKSRAARFCHVCYIGVTIVTMPLYLFHIFYMCFSFSQPFLKWFYIALHFPHILLHILYMFFPHILSMGF